MSPIRRSPLPNVAAIIASGLLGFFVASPGVSSFHLPPSSMPARPPPSSCNNSCNKGSVHRRHYASQFYSSADGEKSDTSAANTTATSSAIEEDAEQLLTELAPNNDDEETSGESSSFRQQMFAELEKMRNQFAEMKDSLTQAKKREEEAQVNVVRLRAQKDAVVSEKNEAIQNKKMTYSQEMTDISDQLEGAQDSLRETILKTRSEISDIQNQAKESEGRLRNEISELESRLEFLRQEAVSAAKSRDSVTKQTKKEIEDIRSASRREMNEEKRKNAAKRKEIRRGNYAQENRIQQAEFDMISAVKELEKAEKVTPQVSFLREALDAAKKNWGSAVDELKEQKAANDMMFALKAQMAKDGLEVDLDKAKSDFELAASTAKGDLADTISSYEEQLENKSRQLLNNLRLSNERADRAVADAIAAAKKNRIALYQEKFEAVEKQRNERADAMRHAKSAQSAAKDQYEAEIEHEVRNLNDEKVRANERLQEQDRLRETQKLQLMDEMESLTIQLARQMKDEKEAAEEDLRRLKEAKATELASSRTRTQRALSDIQTTRSNLVLVQDELRRLEQTSKQKDFELQELESERRSFRKQFKRTMAVGFDRLTLKELRNRRKSKP
eukprot:g14026.t1 g14026   contig9:988866-990813(-)